MLKKFPIKTFFFRNFNKDISNQILYNLKVIFMPYQVEDKCHFFINQLKG